MSTDRERNHGMGNHDMTRTDIALLLANAADGAEIGTPPVQAVLRGGQRRRARRWAVTAATALALAGSAGGTLAVAGLPGDGHGERGAVVATHPPTARERHVYQPQRTELASGIYRGKEWRVAVELWGAPRDKTEAARQFDAMDKAGRELSETGGPADLIGNVTYFVTRSWGEHPPQAMLFNTVPKLSRYAGKDLQAFSANLGFDAESADRLVVGQVARTARQVKCAWKDGTSTVAVPRQAAGFPPHWFVCVAPAGTTYRSAEVIR